MSVSSGAEILAYWARAIWGYAVQSGLLWCVPCRSLLSSQSLAGDDSLDKIPRARAKMKSGLGLGLRLR